MVRVSIQYGFTFFVVGFWVSIKEWKLTNQEAIKKIDELMSNLKWYQSVEVKIAKITDKIF